MILKNLRKTDNGSYEFDFTVSDDEAEYLMEFAIQELIKQGIIKISGLDSEFEFLEFTEEDTLQ